MKLLSIIVPCYNSQDYMEHCIRTLLPGGDRVEILLIDDGSSDNTGEIADEYQERYPSIVRAIHQENKGHGGALNTGINLASGYYLKVVDSDDWVDGPSYKKILDTLERLLRSRCSIDMFISNFVYEKTGEKHKRVIHYRGALPQDQVFGWSETGHFRMGQFILMHSIIYRTKLLRDCHLKLPEHTFYVDNLYVYQPLPHVKKMYYLDVDFYRYYIGREDQSVNEKVMISRIDQQIRVSKMVIDCYNPWLIMNKHLRNYMIKYIKLLTMVTCSLLIKENTDESFEKKHEYWRYIRKKHPKLYHEMRKSFAMNLYALPGKVGRYLLIVCYTIARKVFGFN